MLRCRLESVPMFGSAVFTTKSNGSSFVSGGEKDNKPAKRRVMSVTDCARLEG